MPILGANKAALSLCDLMELLERMQMPCDCALHGSRSTMALSKCRHMTHMADEHQVLVSKVAARIPLGHVGCSEGPLTKQTKCEVSLRLQCSGGPTGAQT